MEGEEICVNAGEMAKAQSPDILWTDGLGPCIAVAVYDPATKSGYLMHAFSNTHIESQIEQIRADYGDLKRLRVFVTGGSLSDYLGPEQERADMSGRSYIEEVIAKYFSRRRTKINWLPDNHCGELSLDTSTGRFKADSETEDELLYDEPTDYGP